MCSEIFPKYNGGLQLLKYLFDVRDLMSTQNTIWSYCRLCDFGESTAGHPRRVE